MLLGLFGAGYFLFGVGVGFEESLEADFCGSERQLVVYCIESQLFLLDVAGLTHPYRRVVLFQRVDADLLLLLANHLGLLLDELNVL